MRLHGIAPAIVLSTAMGLGSCASKPTAAKNPDPRQPAVSSEQKKPEDKTKPAPSHKPPRIETPFRLPDPERVYLEPPADLADFAEALSLCRAAIDGANVFMQSHLADPGPKGCRTAQAFVDSKQRAVDFCSAAAATEVWDLKVLMIKSTLKANIKKWQEEVDKTKTDLPQCFKISTRRADHYL
jgi:hypothetical protein